MNREITMMVSETFVPVDCPGCGVTFAVTKRFNDCRRENKKDFYCPNGHRMSYTESTADCLRRERDRLAQQIAERDDEIKRQCKLRVATERQLTAAKGQATKLRKRVSAGVCTDCNRSFENLRRHMETKHKHSTFAAEALDA